VTDPTTPTGQRLVRENEDAYAEVLVADIIAIEHEAAAAERVRLRAIAADPDQSTLGYCPDELHGHAHKFCVGGDWRKLLEEPE